MHDADTSEWTRPSTIVWAVVLGLAVLAFGKSFVTAFRPPDDYTTDFIQEWLSVRNYFASEPVYENQLDSLARHWPAFRPSNPDTFLPWNAHPPAAVLVALPFARLGFQDAQLAWNAVTFGLFLASIGLAWRELATRFRPWHVLATAAVVLFAAPVSVTLSLGQVNFLLTFLLTLGWVADRRGYQLGAGLAVGVAAGLKLFPGFVLLYFLAAGRWRAAVGLVVGAVALNAAALGVFGVGAFEAYVRDVMPSLQVFQSGWRNLSINGWMLRFLDPHPTQAGPDAYRNHTLALGLTGAAALLVVSLVGWAAWRSKRTADPDRGWAVALVGMLLVSPITWQHYLVILVAPLGILAVRLPAVLRWFGWVVTAILCLPTGAFGLLVLGRTRGKELGPAHHVAMTQAQNLAGISVQTYALVALFVLTLLVPARPAPTSDGARP